MVNILEGITVLDFTQVIAGPACTRLMAELGAEVIKVELAPIGDQSRLLPVVREGRSGYFCQHNQGKKSLCLDMQLPEAQALVQDLVRRSDVLVENFSPGAIARLGLDWETVNSLNPELIMCSISAFGQSGPLKDMPGFDYIGQAYSGATSMIGEPDEPPALTAFAVGDVGTSMTALAAINGALFFRTRTGKGQYLDISLVDFYVHTHELNLEVASLTGVAPQRAGSHHPAAAPLGIYRAKDGFVMIVALEMQWPRLCAAMEKPYLENDPRFVDAPSRLANRDALTYEIETWILSMPGRDAVIQRLTEARVPAAPILSVDEAMREPHLIERGTVRRIDDPVLGPFMVSGNPLRFSETKPSLPSRAPFLGEHNLEILSRYLGFTEADVAALTDQGVLYKESLPEDR
jgi:crotonobetainyl-CoA:carnitine CoA-transferase CaiB-like acyl-CoA transferase